MKKYAAVFLLMLSQALPAIALDAPIDIFSLSLSDFSIGRKGTFADGRIAFDDSFVYQEASIPFAASFSQADSTDYYVFYSRPNYGLAAFYNFFTEIVKSYCTDAVACVSAQTYGDDGTQDRNFYVFYNAKPMLLIYAKHSQDQGFYGFGVQVVSRKALPLEATDFVSTSTILSRSYLPIEQLAPDKPDAYVTYVSLDLTSVSLDVVVKLASSDSGVLNRSWLLQTVPSHHYLLKVQSADYGSLVNPLLFVGSGQVFVINQNNAVFDFIATATITPICVEASSKGVDTASIHIQAAPAE